MKILFSLVRRNMKLFFNDIGMFLSALITPLILLILYSTFLKNVYKSSFLSYIPQGVTISDKLVNGFVSAQMFSSLIAVSCVTVACCVNLTMVQDKVTGARKDFTIAPVKPSIIALSYYISSVFNTLIIIVVATIASFIYISTQGWYFSAVDIITIFLDIILLTLFGTAISSVINCKLTTQGQMSAVGTIISCSYGFICGAYMPISQFSDKLKNVLLCLPFSYATSIFRNHSMRGFFEEMENVGFPTQSVDQIKDYVDCNLYFNGKQILLSEMIIILIATIVLLLTIYIFINYFSSKKSK